MIFPRSISAYLLLTILILLGLTAPTQAKRKHKNEPQNLPFTVTYTSAYATITGTVDACCRVDSDLGGCKSDKRRCYGYHHQSKGAG
ncbi:hypothetical protein DSL72_006745 [Monilinia vaccinii-corymbosi]|uniref:Uncharacterized protein n=1 Tax=Monilinia vaccinii-corymbosi TaxID=61207 RepID=A0A8A3PN12_9HELO|nr:hypothetical protein DSL72_006745 [Monilinia vaccinii-corymbosi]